MVKTQLHRMQGLPRQAQGQIAAARVHRIANDRVVRVGAVHADLVGAARVELEAQQGVIAQTFDHLPVGAGVTAAVITDDGILLAVDRVAADGADNRPGIGCRLTVHHRQVLAAGDALLDLDLQPHQCLLALGHDDAAGGVLVETVHDAGTHLTADAGQVRAMVQQAVDQGAVLVARCRMHGEAGGLVEHNQMGVLKQHIQGHRLGQQVLQRLGRGHPQRDHITRAQGRLGPAGDAVDPHVTGVDELLDAGSALLGALAHQPAIQTHRQRLGVAEGQQLTLALPEPTHGSSRAIGPNRPQR